MTLTRGMARYFATPAARCPVCGMTIQWRYVRAREPFECPRCGERLRVAKRHGQVLSVIAFGVALLAAFAIGARGWTAMAIGIILLLPIAAVLGAIVPLIFGLPLEPAPTGLAKHLGDE